MHAEAHTDSLSMPPLDSIQVPDVIPIFPLPRVVLLPGEVLPLHVFEPRYRELVRDAVASHNVMGIVEVRPGCERELPGSPPVREVGCVGYIAAHEELPDGRFLLWLIGLERFRILEELEAVTAYRQVRVRYEPSPDAAPRLAGVSQLREELRGVLPELLEIDDAARGQFAQHMAGVSDAQLVALACQVLELPSDRKQEVLEAASLADRFLLLYEDLYRHLEA
ncbi:MAG: LON peptidase substrate-binding domain-containing protein, partial [Thermoanaerobaculales bacterium]|nr:LON peptidase substrate-binding domain-containing protein [Thermoanaerobaculales bacterium]